MRRRIDSPEPKQHSKQRLAGVEAMQGLEPCGGFFTAGEGALSQHVLLHDRCPIGLGWGISGNCCQQGFQLLQHQGLAGVRPALSDPKTQCLQINAGGRMLWHFGALVRAGIKGKPLTRRKGRCLVLKFGFWRTTASLLFNGSFLKNMGLGIP